MVNSRRLFPTFVIIFCCSIAVLFMWATFARFFGGAEPRPKIDSGKFPFKVIYEIEGKDVIIEDSIIVKYKGTDYKLDRLTPYRWSSTFESGKENSEILNSLGYENGLVLYEGVLKNNKNYAVLLNLGKNAYYMGYLSAEYAPGNICIAVYELDSKNGTTYSFHAIKESDLESLCGFKMIETTFSKPIQRTD